THSRPPTRGFRRPLPHPPDDRGPGQLSPPRRSAASFAPPPPPAAHRGRSVPPQSARSGGRRHFGGEILFIPIDAFAQRIAHEAGYLDRAADLALGLLDRLGHVLVRVMNIGLIEQTDFLVEGLEP